MATIGRYDMTVRLDGTGLPAGDIGFDALARTASALQELATRVGRSVVGQREPGRTVNAAAGRLKAVRGAVLQAALLPESWSTGGRASLNAVVDAAPGPDPDGIDGVTRADVDDLLAAIDGRG